MRTLGLPRIVAAKDSRRRRLVLAMIAARILGPKSKLATTAGLRKETRFDSLGAELAVEHCDVDDLYDATDWLLARKAGVEQRLAKKHLDEGSLLLCDVTSTYVEGKAMDLAKYGYSRDRKKGTTQIVLGLLCNEAGCPVGVEVFAGNTADPCTLSDQITKVQQQFGLERIVLVGDRGLLTEARIRENVKPAGFDWISALRKDGIRTIVEQDNVQMSLFDEQDLVEVRTDLYPGERIVLCRNPYRAEESARKREALLQATEKALDKIVKATQRSRRPLRNAGAIGERVGKVLKRWKMGKHIRRTIKEGYFHYERNQHSIAQEQAFDGVYAIRSNLPEPDSQTLIKKYKRLSRVEQAFRNLKSKELQIRPIRHYKTPRVISHIFLCMLSYYVQWHMKERLAPMLFAQDDPQAKEAVNLNAVLATKRSPAAKKKAQTKKTESADVVLCFQSLMEHLATLCKYEVRPRNGTTKQVLTMMGSPTRTQERAFKLLDIKLK